MDQSTDRNDYEDYYMVSKDDAVAQYERAVEFYEAVKAYLESIE